MSLSDYDCVCFTLTGLSKRAARQHEVIQYCGRNGTVLKPCLFKHTTSEY